MEILTGIFLGFWGVWLAEDPSNKKHSEAFEKILGVVLTIAVTALITWSSVTEIILSAVYDGTVKDSIEYKEYAITRESD